VALYPAYIKIAGSLSGGALLSQCMYWFSKKDAFHKTDSEFMDELCLTAGEMRGAKSKVRKLDFIDITRKGVPAKTWYSIDWDAFQKTMTAQFSEINQTGENTGFDDCPSLVNSTKLDVSNSPNKNSEINQTYYSNTKITTKTTTESSKKTPKNPKNNFHLGIDLSNLEPSIDFNVAKQWLTHRKAKKCKIEDQSTFDRQMKQAIKASEETYKEIGLSPTEVIEESIDAGWQGIGKPEWLRNRLGVKSNATRETQFEREEREHKEYLRQRSRFVGGNESQIPHTLGRTDGVKLI